MKKIIVRGFIVLITAAVASGGAWAKNEGQGKRYDKSMEKSPMIDRDEVKGKMRDHDDDDDEYGRDKNKYKEKAGGQHKSRNDDDDYEGDDDGRDKNKHKEKVGGQRRSRDDDDDGHRGSDDYDRDQGAPGLAKQRDKKAMQERKELGRGSEQGQQMREEHSRKWWKFWE